MADKEAPISGVAALKHMGIMPQHLQNDPHTVPSQGPPPNKAERKKLREELGAGALGDINQQPRLEGKPVNNFESGCGGQGGMVCCANAKNKQSMHQSGKWAKTQPKYQEDGNLATHTNPQKVL